MHPCSFRLSRVALYPSQSRLTSPNSPAPGLLGLLPGLACRCRSSAKHTAHRATKSMQAGARDDACWRRARLGVGHPTNLGKRWLRSVPIQPVIQSIHWWLRTAKSCLVSNDFRGKIRRERSAFSWKLSSSLLPPLPVLERRTSGARDPIHSFNSIRAGNQVKTWMLFCGAM